MRACFTRPVEIDGIRFEAGRDHVIPPALRSHWFFMALLKDGAAKITEEDKPVPAPAAVAKAEPAMAEKPAHPAKTGKATRKRKGA